MKRNKKIFAIFLLVTIALLVISDGCSQPEQETTNPKKASSRQELIEIAKVALRKKRSFPSDLGYKITSIELFREKLFGNSFLGKHPYVGRRRYAHIVRFSFTGKYHRGEWVDVYIDMEKLVPIGGSRCK